MVGAIRCATRACYRSLNMLGEQSLAGPWLGGSPLSRQTAMVIPERRAFLLGQLGAGATERIVDPGRNIVEARLSDPETGVLSSECDSAIGRWYSRK